MASEQDEDYMVQKELLLKVLSMKGKRDCGVTPVKKEVAPNLFQTVGVILTVDGAWYPLPMDLLQERNRYQLPNSPMCPLIYSPFSVMKLASKMWNCRADEDIDIQERALIEKHFDFSNSAMHPCPDERELQFAPIGESEQIIIIITKLSLFYWS